MYKYMCKKFACLMIAFTLLLGPALPVLHAETSDEPSAWAKADVEQAQEHQLVPYSLTDHYSQNITREEFSEALVLLYTALTDEEPKALSTSYPFKDVSNTDVFIAFDLGLVKGTSATTFSPDEKITREQMAVMLLNLMKKTGMDSKLSANATVAFADAKDVASWAADAVATLGASEVMQGSQSASGLLFQPKQSTSREQAIVLVNRIYNKYGVRFVKDEDDLLDAVEAQQPFAIKDARTKEIYDKATEIIAKVITPEMSEYDKELAIHNYLLLNVAYDYDNYQNNTIPTDSYSPYGALLKGTAVCQGYAETAKLLLNMAGIEAHIVSGTANGGGHAWNKVKIGGEYYNLDVTWDDPVPDVAGRLTYSYFNVTDEELRADHTWEDELPAADKTTYNYYEVNHLTVNSPQELSARIAAAIAAGATSVTVKLNYVPDKSFNPFFVIPTGSKISGYSYSSSSNHKVYTYTFRYK